MKFLTLMLALQLVPSVTFAMGGKGDYQKRAENLKKELSLTDEQVAKVQEIRKGHREDRKADKERLKKEKEIFKEAMKNPNSTKEELIKKYEAFQKLKNEQHRKKFDMMISMRETLNPEQRKKFVQMNKKERKNKK